MVKTYFNNAVIGNSRMLGCLTDKGELVRLFWPNIDYRQHIDRMTAGIFFTGRKNSTVWIDGSEMRHTQHYLQDTNILMTVGTGREKGLRVSQADYVLPERDILIRQYEVENTSGCETDLGFVLYSSFVTSISDKGNTLFDFSCDALIHYSHGYYISISADRDVYQFQIGNNAYESARHMELKGFDSIGMTADGAVSWNLGRICPGEKKLLVVSICASHTLKGVKKLISYIRNSDLTYEYENTRAFWKNFLRNAKHINTGREEIDNLYKRSLLVFKLMTDEKTGGILASPEIDEGFTKCGRYAYCWGRDAAFIAGAMDKCGLTGIVDRFYEWAVQVQEDDGSWLQRYHMDGNLAPSWGLQIDETGSVIWGMLRHYEVTRDIDFLARVWDTVKAGVEFLLNFIDGETGLPNPSYDLWEERIGEHAYSAAAVYGGIKAAAEIARILEVPGETAGKWNTAAEGIKDAIVKNFWREDRKRFLRSVRTKLNPWGSEYSSRTVVIKVNPKEYYRDVTLEDGTVDASLLGLCTPYDVFDINDYRVENTVEVIERVLASPVVGGIKRYETDGYIGGNPWILTTLWAALHHIRKKDYSKARIYFDWAVKSRTELDFLPEQVNRENGRPAWVIPLTWSHAMYVLVLFGLVEAGAL